MINIAVYGIAPDVKITVLKKIVIGAVTERPKVAPC